MADGDITVQELKARLDAGEPLQIVDVREPREHEICRIPGAVLIPLAQLAQRLDELDPQREVVVHCKMGGRSARATAFLRGQGFSNARNLSGGILAWIDQVDPSQRRY
jgi:adenylyltransferase/sulfurtransferase